MTSIECFACIYSVWHTPNSPTMSPPKEPQTVKLNLLAPKEQEKVKSIVSTHQRKTTKAALKRMAKHIKALKAATAALEGELAELEKEWQ